MAAHYQKGGLPPWDVATGGGGLVEAPPVQNDYSRAYGPAMAPPINHNHSSCPPTPCSGSEVVEQGTGHLELRGT